MINFTAGKSEIFKHSLHTDPETHIMKALLFDSHTIFSGVHMRPTKLWRLLAITLAILACSLFSPVPETPDTPTSTPSPPTPKPPEPAPETPSNLDKWSLWTNGTQLRGANTWQRIVVPRYDGDQFLGNSYIGPPYTQEDFNRLASLGANYVNLSHPGIFTERPPYVLDEAVQANLDSMIAMAAEADMFVVITFRTGPGRNDFTFYRDDDWFASNDLIESVWSDAEAQAAWVEMWRHTAERYRSNPVVVGYDLMCEPNSNEILDEWDQDEFDADYAGSIYDWNSWYPNIVTAIREVDSETPILVGGNGYSALDWLPYLETIEAERIVYTFHQYSPHMYTHHYPGEEYSYPGQFDTDYDGQADAFNQAWLEDFLSTASDYADEHNVVLAVNEFGAVRWGDGAADFMRDEMALFEELGLNHALWVWDPVWPPWNEGVNALNFRFGPDLENVTDVENELQSVITDFWARNTIRPSNFYIETRESKLEDVTHWFYFIGDIPTDETFDQIITADYDMVVLDFIPSVVGDEDYPMTEVLTRLHDTDKLVLAYIDIGEAESYRVYWEDNWRVGNPDWIVGEDPDGWAENYPVAFWNADWQALWLEEDGLLDQIGAVGFDGVYLDWIEAYSDENVVEAARREGINPVYAMIEFVSSISTTVKEDCGDCLVIAQNAAELVEYDEYAAVINGLAQEQVWFDGGADNEPEGDCPLPRTDADIDTDEYYDSLSPVCKRQYDEYPESTLHVSSEEYLYYLNIAQEKGIPVFTVDYALDPENVAWVYDTSRDLGFIPFVSNRGLDMFMDPVP
jgi:cysteinyl-tRNA synthetase